MKKRNLLSTAVTLSVLMSAFAVSGAYAAEKMNQYNLSEVVVEAERGNLAGGMMQTRQKVGMFLGEKDTLDVPLHEVTFTKEALDIYSQPGRGMLDTLALDPAVRASHGSMDTSVSIRGLSSHGMKWTLNGVPGMSHQMQMPYNFVDTVSVIAGPSIGITGMSTSMSTQSGGVVNMVSKKAQAEPNADLKLGWSTNNYLTQSIDVGQRFGKNKEYGIRINAMNASGDLSVEGTHDLQRNVYINLDRVGKHSNTNLLAGYDYDNEDGRSNTINLAGNMNSLPGVPNNKKNLSPTWSNDTYKNWTAVLNHEQKFADNMSYFVNAGWLFDFTGKGKSIGTSSFWEERNVNVYMNLMNGAEFKAHHTIEDELQYITDLGKIVGNESKAASLAAGINNKILRYRQQLAAKKRLKVLVVSNFGKTITIYTPRTLAGDILTRLGADVIGKQQEAVGENEYISYEEILTSQPDVIFLQCSPENENMLLKSVYNNPALRNVKCIKNRQVYCIPFYTIRSPGVRIDDAVDIFAKGLIQGSEYDKE